MCYDPEWCLESQVTANSFSNIKLNHFKESQTILSGWSCYISPQIMKSLVMECPPQACRPAEHLIPLLPIKFLMVSGGRLSNSCDMWNCKLFKFSAHFHCVIETHYWPSLKQYIRAILYPNLVHFHAQKFIWWCFQILSVSFWA